MSTQALEIETGEAVSTFWLNRPDLHNAFDDHLLEELTDAFQRAVTDASIRAIVLAARGQSFCAGAQVQWMRAQGTASPERNLMDARKLAAMFDAIDRCPKPTVARVQGAAFGGGVGLVAACDIAIGSSAALFGMTEVRLGLLPATVGPYILRAIGSREARRLFLTGERFPAEEALRLGLLHKVVAPEDLDAAVSRTCEQLLLGAPGAQGAIKDLVHSVAGRPVDAGLMEETAAGIAERRATEEAREGLAAFLEKRPARWVRPL